MYNMLGQENVKTSFWLKKQTVFVIYFISINAINIQSIITHKLNVWKIFRCSYYLLIQHKDFYAFHPELYFDQYQYSPSFPMLFAPFAALPYYIGYFLWNNLNMMLMPYLIFKIKGIDDGKKSIICYFAILEMLTCLQGTQSNVMIAILMVAAFLSFENKNYWLAAFAIAAGTYIKAYPIVAASLFLLYPDKIKFLLKLTVAMLVLGALPLLVLSPKELATLYHNWYAELVVDQSDNYGKISLTGLIQAYFNISDAGKLMVQIGGVITFCFMYIRYNLFKHYNYRLYFLSVLLIWGAIFNHAGEIYGYAIAIWGIGIWYALQKPSKGLHIFMVLFLIFGTVLSIDPTPHIILDYIYEHGLKALPFTCMFFYFIWEMLRKKEVFFKKNDT
jgi:Glycosyltransferase family 87